MGLTEISETSLAATKSQARRTIPSAVLLGCAALLVVVRWHAFGLPLETDECNYAYIAHQLLEGHRLYVDVWDHQPPGIYMLFAGVIAWAGDAPEVFRLLAMAASLVSLLFLYKLVKHTTRSTPTALLAGLLFALVSSDPGTAGEGCNRELFMNATILASWYALLRKPSPSRRAILLAGFALGVGSLIKTVVAVHWLLLAIWLGAATAWRGDKKRSRGQTMATLAVFSIGPGAIWLVTTMYFSATGRFAEFVDAVFLFNLSYSDQSANVFSRFLGFFTPPRHPFIFDSAYVLWILGIPALLWLLGRAVYLRCRADAAVVALGVASYLAACLPGRFWPHYYYLMIPPLVIALPVAINRVTTAECVRRRWNRHASITAIALGILVVVVLGWTQYRDYLSQPAFGITVKRYNSRDFWGRAIGEKIRQVTDPTDTVFVYGNEAEIYYYARRHCASRYTMITGLSESDPNAPLRRARLLNDLEKNRPRVIVVLFDEKPFPAWRSYLEAHCGMAVGWDCHDRYSSTCAHPDPSHVIMLVYVDKTRPIAPMDWSWDRSEVGGWIPKELMKP